MSVVLLFLSGDQGLFLRIKLSGCFCQNWVKIWAKTAERTIPVGKHTPRAIQNFQRMLWHPSLYSEMTSGLK